MFKALLWLFSPAWNAVNLIMQVGFICPFVVSDPTDLGATIVVARALCLTIFPAFLPIIIKLTRARVVIKLVCVCRRPSFRRGSGWRAPARTSTGPKGRTSPFRRPPPTSDLQDTQPAPAVRAPPPKLSLQRNFRCRL